jgi:hypothetical protein
MLKQSNAVEINGQDCETIEILINFILFLSFIRNAINLYYIDKRI